MLFSIINSKPEFVINDSIRRILEKIGIKNITFKKRRFEL